MGEEFLSRPFRLALAFETPRGLKEIKFDRVNGIEFEHKREDLPLQYPFSLIYDYGSRDVDSLTDICLTLTGCHGMAVLDIPKENNLSASIEKWEALILNGINTDNK